MHIDEFVKWWSENKTSFFFPFKVDAKPTVKESYLLSRNWELCAVCCVLDSGGPGLGLGLVLWLVLGLGFAVAEFVFSIALARPPPRVAFRADSSCCRAAWACWRSNWSCIWSCWSCEAEGPELSWPPAERRTPDNWDRSSGGRQWTRQGLYVKQGRTLTLSIQFSTNLHHLSTLLSIRNSSVQ